MAKKRAKIKRKRLTPKQIKLLIGLTKGQSGAKAAIQAGYSDKNPRQSAHQALEEIRKSIPDLLVRHGLDDDAIIDKHLLPLLNANETKFFPYSKRGKRLLLERNVISWGPRSVGLDILMKIRGLYVREAENTGPQFSVVIIDSRYRPDWDAMNRANETEEQIKT